MADTKTIAVDFDGVIHRYSRGWQDGTIYDPPKRGALTGLRRLMAHYAVFVFTSRQPYPVAQWLDGHGIPAVTEMDIGLPVREFWDKRGELLVTNRKLPAAVYLDDRAVRFTTWPSALYKILGADRD